MGKKWQNVRKAALLFLFLYSLEGRNGIAFEHEFVLKIEKFSSWWFFVLD